MKRADRLARELDARRRERTARDRAEEAYERTFGEAEIRREVIRMVPWVLEVLERADYPQIDHSFEIAGRFGRQQSRAAWHLGDTQFLSYGDVFRSPVYLLSDGQVAAGNSIIDPAKNDHWKGWNVALAGLHRLLEKYGELG